MPSAVTRGRVAVLLLTVACICVSATGYLFWQQFRGDPMPEPFAIAAGTSPVVGDDQDISKQPSPVSPDPKAETRTEDEKGASSTFAILLVGEHTAGELIELQLMTAVTTHGLTAVDRNHLRTLLDEQALTVVQHDDRETHVRLGHVIGAEVLVFVESLPVNGQSLIRLRVVESRTGLVLDEALFEWPEGEPTPAPAQQSLARAKRRLDVPVDDRLYVALPAVTWEATPLEEQAWLPAIIGARLRTALQADDRVTLLERETLLDMMQEQWLADLPVDLKPMAAMVEVGLRPTEDLSMMEVAVRVTRSTTGDTMGERRRVIATPETLTNASHELIHNLVGTEAEQDHFGREAELNRLVQRGQWLATLNYDAEAVEAYEAAVAFALDDHRRLIELLITLDYRARRLWAQSESEQEMAANLDRYIRIAELYQYGLRRLLASEDGSWRPYEWRSPIQWGFRGLGSIRDEPAHLDRRRRLIRLSEQQFDLQLQVAETMGVSAHSIYEDAFARLPHAVDTPDAFIERAKRFLETWWTYADEQDHERGSEWVEPGFRLLSDLHIDRGLSRWSVKELRPFLAWCEAEAEFHVKLVASMTLARNADKPEAVERARQVLFALLTDEVAWDKASEDYKYNLDSISSLTSSAFELLRDHGEHAHVIDELIAHFEASGSFHCLSRRWSLDALISAIRTVDRHDDRRVRQLIAAIEAHAWQDQAGNPHQQTYLYRNLNAEVIRRARLRGEKIASGPMWDQVTLEPVTFQGRITQTHHPINYYIAYRSSKRWEDQTIYMAWIESIRATYLEAPELVFTRAPVEGGPLEIIARGTVPIQPRREKTTSSREVWRDTRFGTHFVVIDDHVFMAGPWGIWIVSGTESEVVALPEGASSIFEADIISRPHLWAADAALFLHTRTDQLYRFDFPSRHYELLVDQRSVVPRTALDGATLIGSGAIQWKLSDHDHAAFYVHVNMADYEQRGLWRFSVEEDDFERVDLSEPGGAFEGIGLHGDQMGVSNLGRRFRIDRTTGGVLSSDYWPSHWPEQLRLTGGYTRAYPGRHLRVGSLLLDHGKNRNRLRLISPKGESEGHPDALPGYVEGWETVYGAWIVIDRSSAGMPVQFRVPRIYRARHVDASDGH